MMTDDDQNKSTGQHVKCSLALDRLPPHFVQLSLLPNYEYGRSNNAILCLFCDQTHASPGQSLRHCDLEHLSTNLGRRASIRNSVTGFSGCSICAKDKKLFSSHSNDLTALFHHLVDKHSDRYFGCKLCDVRFPAKDALHSHNTSVHRPPAKKSKRSGGGGDGTGEEAKGGSGDIKESSSKTVERTICTRQSKFERKSNRIPRNAEPMLSRLGLAQNRSPRTMKGAKNRRGAPSEPQSRPSRAKLNRSVSNLSITDSTSNSTTSSILPQTTSVASASGTVSTSSKPQPSSSSTSCNNGIFDEDFYENVCLNVRQNLSAFMDGKLETTSTTISANLATQTIDPLPTVRSTVVKSPAVIMENEIHEATALSAITSFPTLLTAEQYGVEGSGSKIKRIFTKNSWKWKWDFVRKYKYVNEGGKIVKKVKEPNGGVRDLAKLDMWTQLTMRMKHESVAKNSSPVNLTFERNNSLMEVVSEPMMREEKRKLVDQLNAILDSRLLPQISVEQNEQRLIKLESVESAALDTEGPFVSLEGPNPSPPPSEPKIESISDRHIEPNNTQSVHIPSILNLQRNPAPRPVTEVVLSGEWARPRCYVCFGCGAKFHSIKTLEEHKISDHPHVHSTHYEIVGRELIEGDLYKNLFIPQTAITQGNLRRNEENEVKKPDVALDSSETKVECTKCKKECSGKTDLYRHMLDCVGDYAWLMAKKRLKYRYFNGNRSKRRKATNARLIFGCLRTTKIGKKEYKQKIKKRKMRSRQKPQKPSDVETIQRMLANLPAKRISRNVYHTSNKAEQRRSKIGPTARISTKFNVSTNRSLRSSLEKASTSKESSSPSKNNVTPSKNSDKKQIQTPVKTPVSVDEKKPTKQEPVKEKETPPASTKTTPTRRSLRENGPLIEAKTPENNPVESPKKPAKRSGNIIQKIPKATKGLIKKIGNSIKCNLKKPSSPGEKDDGKEEREEVERSPKNGLISEVKEQETVLVKDNESIKEGVTIKNPLRDQEDEKAVINITASEVIEPEKELQINTSVAIIKEQEILTVSVKEVEKLDETNVPGKLTDASASMKSPPGIKRTRKLNDCIARLTDKLQEKLGVAFFDNPLNLVSSEPTKTTTPIVADKKTVPIIIEPVKISPVVLPPPPSVALRILSECDDVPLNLSIRRDPERIAIPPIEEEEEVGVMDLSLKSPRAMEMIMTPKFNKEVTILNVPVIKKPIAVPVVVPLVPKSLEIKPSLSRKPSSQDQKMKQIGNKQINHIYHNVQQDKPNPLDMHSLTERKLTQTISPISVIETPSKVVNRKKPRNAKANKSSELTAAMKISMESSIDMCIESVIRNSLESTEPSLPFNEIKKVSVESNYQVIELIKPSPVPVDTRFVAKPFPVQVDVVPDPEPFPEVSIKEKLNEKVVNEESITNPIEVPEKTNPMEFPAKSNIEIVTNMTDIKVSEEPVKEIAPIINLDKPTINADKTSISAVKPAIKSPRKPPAAKAVRKPPARTPKKAATKAIPKPVVQISDDSAIEVSEQSNEDVKAASPTSERTTTLKAKPLPRNRNSPVKDKEPDKVIETPPEPIKKIVEVESLSNGHTNNEEKDLKEKPVEDLIPDDGKKDKETKESAEKPRLISFGGKKHKEIAKSAEQPKVTENGSKSPVEESKLEGTTKSNANSKPRKKRKNELAQIIADQLLESFKEVDKSRIDDLKILHDLSCSDDNSKIVKAVDLPDTRRRNVVKTNTGPTQNVPKNGKNTIRNKANLSIKIPEVSNVEEIEDTAVESDLIKEDLKSKDEVVISTPAEECNGRLGSNKDQKISKILPDPQKEPSKEVIITKAASSDKDTSLDKHLDWVSKASELNKTGNQSDDSISSKALLSKTSGFILKPSRLQALTSPTLDLFDSVKTTEKSSPLFCLPIMSSPGAEQKRLVLVKPKLKVLFPDADSSAKENQSEISADNHQNELNESNATDDFDKMSVTTSGSVESAMTTATKKNLSPRKRKMRKMLTSKKKAKTRDPSEFAAKDAQKFHCDICNKNFERPDRLAKHKITLTHIAKLSEIEFLNSQNKKEEKKMEEVVVEDFPIKLVEENLKVESVPLTVSLHTLSAVQLEPISSPEQPLGISDRFNSFKAIRNTNLSVSGLSQEEKLFYECCNMLKGSSDRNGFQSENKSLTPKSTEAQSTWYSKTSTAFAVRSSPKYAFPKLDMNQFSDISSDSNSMVPKSQQNHSKITALSSFQLIEKGSLFGDSAGLPLKRPNSQSYSDSLSDMGDSFPSSQDGSDNENYVKTILDRTNNNADYSKFSLSVNPSTLSDNAQENVFKPAEYTTAYSPDTISGKGSTTIRTKAAMKGFDNFKVSIPTNRLDLQQALERNPHVGSKLAALADIALSTDIISSKKEVVEPVISVPIQPREIIAEKIIKKDLPVAVPVKNVKPVRRKAATTQQSTATKPALGNRLGFKTQKKKSPAYNSKAEKLSTEVIHPKSVLDVYEFEESQDSIQSPIMPLSKSFKAAAADLSEPPSTQLPKLPVISTPEPDQSSQLSSDSFSDRDDFNYNGTTLEDSDDASEKKTKAVPKKGKKMLDTAQKKCLIMGRIFKNAQKSKAADSKATVQPSVSLLDKNDKLKVTEKVDVDKLFDSLKEELPKDKAEPAELQVVSKTVGGKPQEGMRKFEDELGMSRKEIEEIIGMGPRKSKRKCIQQVNFAETWSSDEYEEFQSTKDIIALIQEKESKTTKTNKANIKKKVGESRVQKTVEIKRSSPVAEEPVQKAAAIRSRRKTIGFKEKEESPKQKSKEFSGRYSPVRKVQKIVEKKKDEAKKVDRMSLSQAENEVQLVKKRDSKGQSNRPLARRKRVNSEQLYYWSSSSSSGDDDAEGTGGKNKLDKLAGFDSNVKSLDEDLEDYDKEDGAMEQHGWIVGDSHKKLVTLLAHAKGKKTEVMPKK